MKKTITMPSGNGRGELKIDLVLDEELGDKCGLYAKVTIPAGSEDLVFMALIVKQ